MLDIIGSNEEDGENWPLFDVVTELPENPVEEPLSFNNGTEGELFENEDFIAG